MRKIVQTAVYDVPGEFAPVLAHYNFDVLFGVNRNDPSFAHKQRYLLPVMALVFSGVTDSSLSYHLNNVRQAGVSETEIAGALTNISFYVGRSKA